MVDLVDENLEGDLGTLMAAHHLRQGKHMSYPRDGWPIWWETNNINRSSSSLEKKNEMLN